MKINLNMDCADLLDILCNKIYSILKSPVSYYTPKDIFMELPKYIRENCSEKDINTILSFWNSKGYINKNYIGYYADSD
jgi:hypothetical protein